MQDGGSGSTADEIDTDQLLPLYDRKADIATKRSFVRCGNWLDCPLSDPQAAIANGSNERPFLAESRPLVDAAKEVVHTAGYRAARCCLKTSGSRGRPVARINSASPLIGANVG